MSSSHILKGKDNTIWSQKEADDDDPKIGRASKQNVLKASPGVTSLAKRRIDTESPMSALSLFLDNNIIDHIIKCTEIEARTKLDDSSWSTNREEILRLFGVMYARGFIAKGQSTEHIWSKQWGASYFRETISRDRYKELLRFLRFDVRSTRSDRLKDDKFALFSAVWNRFVENCQAYYNPYEDVTIDEQLFPTKARCPFTQYMASKPDKFGIKFWLAVDPKTKYCLNGFPYLGKDSLRPQNQTLSEYVVLRLMEPYANKGCNATTDNFFPSVKLAEKL